MPISRWIPLGIRNISNKSCRENYNTRLTSGDSPPPPRIVSFMWKCQKHFVESESLQITIWRRVACWIGYATRAQENARACAPTLTQARALTHNAMCNTCCFRTTTMVPQTHLHITLYVRCLSCKNSHCCSVLSRNNTDCSTEQR
jgi:hypothetical protein